MSIIRYNKVYFGRFRNVVRFSKERAKQLKAYIIETTVKRFSNGIKNKQTGFLIKVPANSLGKTLSYGALTRKCKIVTCLDLLIKSAILYEIEADRYDPNFNHLCFVSSLMVGDVLYLVKLNVKLLDNVRLYNLEEMELIKKP